MLEKIRSVIVEDETAAREALKKYLKKYCLQIEVVGEAGGLCAQISFEEEKKNGNENEDERPVATFV